MEKASKIFVAGHLGLVGSAIVRALQKQGFANIITRSRADLDLQNDVAVAAFYQKERPEYVYVAAAKVGGIGANSNCPADFIYENLRLQNNLIHYAKVYPVKKLLFLGSSCIYPKAATQPILEKSLLAGYLEPTNQAYAVAKIAGIVMCQSYRQQYGMNFISLMPTNLYGPGDNFHPTKSHVLPALLRRFYEHKIGNLPAILLWGSGTPRREFLHADDLADAAVFLMQHYDDGEIINVGWGKDITIKELAEKIQLISGYRGQLQWDITKPDGTMQKLLDTSKLTRLGWLPKISLDEGLKRTYDWMVQNYALLANKKTSIHL